MGVSNQTLNNWFVRGVPGRKLIQVARFLDLRPEWLQTGEGSPLNEEQLAEINRFRDASPEQLKAWREEAMRSHPVPAEKAFKYPEIAWHQAASTIDPLALESDGSIKWHSSDAWAGHRGFWLAVPGASMTSLGNASFPEGSLILVDPSRLPNDGQFVLAHLKDSKEFTFKQLVRDAGDLYLKPLNPSYPIKLLDDSWEITGTIVDAKLPRFLFA